MGRSGGVFIHQATSPVYSSVLRRSALLYRPLLACLLRLRKSKGTEKKRLIMDSLQVVRLVDVRFQAPRHTQP